MLVKYEGLSPVVTGWVGKSSWERNNTGMIKNCPRYLLSKLDRNRVGDLKMANWAMAGVRVLYLKGEV